MLWRPTLGGRVRDMTDTDVVYEEAYERTVEFVWHQHGRPRITVGTPPHVHAHINGDDVEHSHEGLGCVAIIGRRRRAGEGRD